MFDVGARTIFVTLAGSQAHGTAGDTSDVDLRAVCVAPMSVRLSLFRRFEQDESPLGKELWSAVLPRLEAHPTAAGGLARRTESVTFDVSKFVALLAAANPNALEILFSDERDWLFETPIWRRLYDARAQFLTRKVQETYLGYAMAQLKRIRTHRSWLLAPPTKKPARTDFGLPEAGTLGSDDRNRIEESIADKLRSYSLDTVELPKPARIALEARLERFWLDTLGCSESELQERLRAVATAALSLPADVTSALNAEKKYLAAMKHWESYQTWQAERNPARAELERKHGYDTKHAMHLVRLMRMGLEALGGATLRVRRSDAAELIAIREGALSYEELIVLATELQARMQAAATTCPLPRDVDHELVDRLLAEVIEMVP